MWLHYQNVSHPIPCPCPLKTVHLSSTCQIISTLCSDAMKKMEEHRGLEQKCTKCFQTYFKHNLHSVWCFT